MLVVNQALVDKYFGGRNPIGHVILFGGSKRHEIVGVVADARYRTVEQPADPTFYLPLEQNDERWPFLAFTVWTDGSAARPRRAAALLRSAVREADPQQPISRLRTIEEILSGSMAERRFNTWIVGLFAATALLLAAVGTYGVMAFAVTSRTRELGVRAALGATPADLIRLVLGQGLMLTLVASAIGLVAAVALDALHGVDALQRRAARSDHVRARRRRPRDRRDRRDADSGAPGDARSTRSTRVDAK